MRPVLEAGCVVLTGREVGGEPGGVQGSFGGCWLKLMLWMCLCDRAELYIAHR
jgi:hypothetical protein